MSEIAPGFDGFPEAALDFYDDLEVDNTKSFWKAHESVYQTSVKAPMTALIAALEPDFGTGKVFRPFRDVRFAKDKTPYKTHQGAYVAVGRTCGWYVEIAARGLRTGAGFYDASSADLARIRASIANELTGDRLEKILAKLVRAGFTVGGDRLKTSPRGYDADHPRIELLRHRTLTVSRDYGFDPIIHTADLLDAVRADWKATRSLVEWVAERLGD
ncbi:TIGR02453 family protein [Mycolicibacterium madagascariense]|uniref:TIGR02453 family protein n=1 Tax=Mycolicibacterium madagascariense TaxID=212765 RepID=A0A7I7XNW6_9MYCO|nr:DUF2461 domain-containing protein [Mycolicibacterium madagascariense]MCV7011989.1 DUF2461 domain-containing protein [Mycolicibacterium madagascariense]BBZ30937.1 TIGR02453 family protein [Mycolicibacterium madagascariense]